MTLRRDPAPSVITAAWNPFAPPAPPRNPLDDIPAHERLPETHPLVTLLDRALTPAGLTDTEWRALDPIQLRPYRLVITTARRLRNDHRRDHGLPLNEAVITHIRDSALADLARITPERQRSPEGELAQVLRQLTNRPPRPATGARALRRALRTQPTTKDAQ